MHRSVCLFISILGQEAEGSRSIFGIFFFYVCMHQGLCVPVFVSILSAPEFGQNVDMKVKNATLATISDRTNWHWLFISPSDRVWGRVLFKEQELLYLSLVKNHVRVDHVRTGHIYDLQSKTHSARSAFVITEKPASCKAGNDMLSDNHRRSQSVRAAISVRLTENMFFADWPPRLG